MDMNQNSHTIPKIDSLNAPLLSMPHQQQGQPFQHVNVEMSEPHSSFVYHPHQYEHHQQLTHQHHQQLSHQQQHHHHQLNQQQLLQQHHHHQQQVLQQQHHQYQQQQHQQQQQLLQDQAEQEQQQIQLQQAQMQQVQMQQEQRQHQEQQAQDSQLPPQQQHHSSQYVEHNMQIAEGIVRRFHDRGGLLPSREQPEDQEFRDAMQLGGWKQALRGKTAQPCPPEVVHFLDKEMPNWKDTTHKNITSSAMQKAQGIVLRYLERGKVLPRDLRGSDHVDEATRKQESRDSAKLNYWKLALKTPQSRHKCPEPVRAYLDEHMPGWTNKIRSINKEPMEFALEIVARYNARGNVLPRELKNRNGDPEREEEYRDATKLRNWKKALRGSGTHMCSEELAQFLDSQMPGWRKPKADKVHLPLHFATDIVARVQQRQGVLPRELKDTRNDPVRIQEYKDACKLNNWKKSLRGIGTHRCPEHIQTFLDEHLPTWRNKAGSGGGGGKKRAREDDGAGRGRAVGGRGRLGGGPDRGEEGGDEELLMVVDGGVDDMLRASGQQHILMQDGQRVHEHQREHMQHEHQRERLAREHQSEHDHEVLNHEVLEHQREHMQREQVDAGRRDDSHDAMLQLPNMEDDDEGEAAMRQTIMQTDIHSELAGNMDPDDMDGDELDAEESNMLNVLTAQI
mmetsp:Transcript_30864/g.57566  ORF Transcript_30864/g.57566 Transcript_30864/m.57566 type:complete len:678 (+) Transcript_30864:100-2133(+)